MSIEIVERATCPTCGGKGYVTCDELRARGVVVDYCHDSDCIECPEPRVLATFADAAALSKKINNAVGFAMGDLGSVSGVTVRAVRDAVLAAMRVSDDQ